MRKITPRDWLALAAPAIVLITTAFFVSRERGLDIALIVCGIGLAFALSLWWRRIRQHPTDTWRFRL